MLSKLVGQLLDSLLSVGEDHALRDDHVLVELDERTELLAVFLERDVELLDTVEGQLLVLHQDLDGVLHELLSHLHDFWRHSGREEADLDVSRQVFEDLSDFVNKSSAEHFVGLVKDNDFEEVGSQGLLLDQILYSSGGSDDDLNAAIFERFSVLAGISSSDAAARVDFDELTEAVNDFVDLLGELSRGGQNDGLAFGRFRVDQLKDADGKSCGLSCS